ncbi:hypothetical protein TD95_004725 [Thielaviopsis punctulata]|uniref:Uncharacterized protein n=1 Tax=Thielaviopsis punctulata TaxID=72032 RepID=A0A0F4ZF97_9PEZI|nr:hypothetical protein TD95_004725 [Thielaviopsis punctulata]
MLTSPPPINSLQTANHRPSSSKSDSSTSSGSPRLPEGQCQAILVGRGAAAGHRCPCNHFTLNQNSPATVCECGHMSCYHAKDYSSFDRTQFRKLQDQLRMFDEQIKRDRNVPLVSLLERVSMLEEQVERNHDDLDQRIKDSNGRIGCVWQQVDVLEKRGKEILHTLPVHAHQIQALGSKVDSYHAELMDSDIALEERIDRLESESWTVHISLLPNRSQPFPFEKDTRAYKRCLSRGLHRYVVVADHSAEAFSRAVTNAFGELLRGRSWMPLQAKLCDVHDLQGLPMLRQLDSSLQNVPYDLNFLRTHCAVLCPGGKLDSLYIAMKEETFSWDFLRGCPVYMEGLDSCWQYDQFIDNETGTVGDLGIIAPLKKRGAAEISRVANLGSYTADSSTPSHTASVSASISASSSGVAMDVNMSRPKIQRTAPGISNVPDVPRAVETI